MAGSQTAEATLTGAARRQAASGDCRARSVPPRATVGAVWPVSTRPVLVVAMTATRYSTADPSEDGVLGVAGLATAVPKLISGFIRA